MKTPHAASTDAFTLIMRRPLALALLLGSAVLSAPAMADLVAGLTELPFLPGGNQSQAEGVTDSGIVVGDSSLLTNNYNVSHAFRWTPTGGMVDLGTLGGTSSAAHGISGDGSAVVGDSQIAGDSTYHAFRWTQAGGMVDLGTLGGTNSTAWGGVSTDGSVVAGRAQLTGDAAFHAFRWTQTGGMADLGTLGGTNSQSFGYGSCISADGLAIAGESQVTGDSAYHAFRWTQGNGMVDLGTLGGADSYGWGLSGDGSVVVGYSYIVGGAASHAFRWTPTGGMVDLGTLGGTYSYANGASGDGSVVVGDSDTTGTGNAAHHAFRWTQAAGMQDLNILLSAAGVDMTGIDLNYGYGVSPNGKYIVGAGTFPDSPYGAFLVLYDPDHHVVGITTPTAQDRAVQHLGASLRGAGQQSHATAAALLGMTAPLTGQNAMHNGGMLGSALGYVSGQVGARGVTVLGGIGYGSEDYPDIRQGAAPTFAAATRYSFDAPFASVPLHPFAEVGGWITPYAPLTVTRSYANGAGTVAGQGGTHATSAAYYGRTGLVWEPTADDQFTLHAELGQQFLAFDAYAEAGSAMNPFPAAVEDGLLRFAVARAGGSWTHHLGSLAEAYGSVPLSLTLAGDAARSFAVHSGLAVTVAGLGRTTGDSTADTWCEFGARITATLSDRFSVSADLSGSTGGAIPRTALHGGGAVSYAF